MAARRAAKAGHTQTKSHAESAPPVCPMNPDCAAEFAAIAEQYKFFHERMDRWEKDLSDGIENIRRYLKEDYAAAVESRVAALSTRIETAEGQITKLQNALDAVTRKMFLAMGGLAVVVFLLEAAASLFPKLFGD